MIDVRKLADRSTFQFAPVGLGRFGVNWGLLSTGMLLVTACSSDSGFSSDPVMTSGNVEPAGPVISQTVRTAEAPASATQGNGTIISNGNPDAAASQPSPGSVNSNAADASHAPSDGADAGGDGSGHEPPPKPDAAPEPPPDAQCGREGQACCARQMCRAGLSCVPAEQMDASAESAFTCKRDPQVPPAPETDAAPEPPPPAPEADAATPPPPPDMPPDPMQACGEEGERCCKGPGGRCEPGLRCDNPGDRELDDSLCVPNE